MVVEQEFEKKYEAALQSLESAIAQVGKSSIEGQRGATSKPNIAHLLKRIIV